MVKVFFEAQDTVSGFLQYVVIAARYQNQWVFVRHRQRLTWEIPGGHIESGESPEEAAKRELWEETGATVAVIQPVCRYGVTREEKTTYGMLYYAEIQSWENLPEGYKIGERKLCSAMPQSLTYPDIQPSLFMQVQIWRNLQSSPNELWDVYDENRRRTGRTHRRGQPLKEGEYHLVVHVWMLNSRGEFLLTKRSPNKGFPNTWESTGGSALAGDDSLTAALREVKEETGLTLDPKRGTLVFSMQRNDYFRDVWLFKQDFDLRDVVLQPEETIDKAYMSRERILQLYGNGEFVPYDYLEDVFTAAGLT